MYKAVKLYNDDKRSGVLKEVIFVIYPETKLKVKQLFLAHRQTQKLKTQHTSTVEQILEEKKKDDGQHCEIRTQIGNNLLQVVNANISDACYVTEAILVLWLEHEINNPGTNPGLKCIDPNNPDWKCSSVVSQLPGKKCIVDETTLPRKMLIHSYCLDSGNESITDAIVEGLKTAEKRNCNTVTIPIASDGRMSNKPRESAKAITEAVKTSLTNVHVITVALQDDTIFLTFVKQVAAIYNLLEPADIDKSALAVALWQKTFAGMAAKSTGSQGTFQTVTANREFVLLVTSESDFKMTLAEQEVRARLASSRESKC